MKRYEQIAKFKEIGEKGQKALTEKSVTIVGMGNIGSTVAVMLVRAGVNLRLIDKGRCLTADLASQSLYLEEDDTRFKAKQAKKRLEQINPEVKVRTFHEDLTKNNLYLIESDAVVDATGNLETGKLISDHAKKKKIPCVFAVDSGSQGFIISTDKGVNIDKLKKLLDKMKPIKEAGIINPAVHMAASIIVKKLFKILLKKPYHKEAVIFDIWKDTYRRQKL
ncbi:MAG: ThiF family adenylyltransferase [Nanoarchaeota archaeon]|nr:ThiF family adenylyltransferase [Nanoarchaeota archaeon]MBU1322377.1 ThiF family adenylyltransferase [Nanoarchaeota archaeon]MBU1598404.1 ThiF family adenylyltransferase [Nanoarchaeota archaeon]MBU2440781.1 ThiF family adenylyltransferase [Nanoarchaeota archaeon]